MFFVSKHMYFCSLEYTFVYLMFDSLLLDDLNLTEDVTDEYPEYVGLDSSMNITSNNEHQQS